jgi:hypothetical protein
MSSESRDSREAMVQRVALSDLLPNPFRRSEHYPLDEARIERLMASMEQSGFWDGSIQARPHPTEPGKFQMAFGHHRLAAARRRGLDAVGVVVVPRSGRRRWRSSLRGPPATRSCGTTSCRPSACGSSRTAHRFPIVEAWTPRTAIGPSSSASPGRTR